MESVAQLSEMMMTNHVFPSCPSAHGVSTSGGRPRHLFTELYRFLPNNDGRIHQLNTEKSRLISMLLQSIKKTIDLEVTGLIWALRKNSKQPSMALWGEERSTGEIV